MKVEPFTVSSELPILPAQESVGGEAGFCRSNDTETQPCFRAGDPRVNENQGERIEIRGVTLKSCC